MIRNESQRIILLVSSPNLSYLFDVMLPKQSQRIIFLISSPNPSYVLDGMLPKQNYMYSEELTKIIFQLS